MKHDHFVQLLHTLDHSTFDAALIKAWSPDYPWVRSRLQGDVPLRPEHYIRHTQWAIAQALHLDEQHYNYERSSLQYAAFETLYRSVQTVHLRQMDLELMCHHIRDDFTRCLKEERLATVHAYSPLWEKGRRRQRWNGVCYEMTISSKHDKQLLASLCGKNVQETCDIFERAVPHLTSLDRGMLDVHQEEFRATMRTLLAHQDVFYPDLQQKIRDATLAAWMQHAESTLVDTLTGISAGLSSETRTPVESCDLISPEEPGRDALLSSVERLLAHDVLSSEERFLLLQRLPGLEYVALTAAQESRIQDLMQIQSVLVRLEKKLQLQLHEYPGLTFALFTIASYCDEYRDGSALTPKTLLSDL